MQDLRLRHPCGRRPLPRLRARRAAPSRAARQVAGLALPTRSVHALPATRPRREHDVRPVGPARAARSAFSFTTTLILLTLAVAGLAWLASQPRFVLQVPDGTAGVLDDITIVSAAARSPSCSSASWRWWCGACGPAVGHCARRSTGYRR